MRIAINTLPLLTNKAGAERYAENILEQFAKIDPVNRYYLISSEINKDIYGIRQQNFESIIYKGNTRSRMVRILGEQLYIPALTRRLRPDIFFTPCNIAPRFVGAPQVVTLFDLHWLIFPELFSKIKLMYLERSIGWSVHNARRIITISENSKKDIIARFGIPEEKVRVTYLGLDPVFSDKRRDEPAIAGTIRKLGIDGKYILSVGQLHKRKNILALIKAFHDLKSRKLLPDHKLVIAGGRGDGHSEIVSYISSHDVKDVIITGCVTDEDILSLYKGADLMVYPSLYEGFGLPVIEAMACGVPVVTSNVSSLPEVAGGAALLIDPYSVAGIAEAMHRVLSNRDLRDNLVQKGLRRAEEFSWEKAAQETLKVFEEVYKETMPR